MTKLSFSTHKNVIARSRATKQSLILIIITLLFSGCASTENYRLKPGDEVRVIIWKEMDEKVIVRPDKKISLPMIGEIDCRKKTIDDLSKEISKQYDATTILMLTKYHTFRDSYKDTLGTIRDISFVYLLVK
jgi:protein involved in polysaccharide export with SLBB domain